MSVAELINLILASFWSLCGPYSYPFSFYALMRRGKLASFDPSCTHEAVYMLFDCFCQEYKRFVGFDKKKVLANEL